MDICPVFLSHIETKQCTPCPPCFPAAIPTPQTILLRLKLIGMVKNDGVAPVPNSIGFKIMSLVLNHIKRSWLQEISVTQ